MHDATVKTRKDMENDMLLNIMMLLRAGLLTPAKAVMEGMKGCPDEEMKQIYARWFKQSKPLV